LPSGSLRCGRRSAGAELELLDGIGHLPHLTRGEIVAERLSSFINEASI
jgi:hypothetical protein